MVTGPMPRKPKATRPKAKIAGADHDRPEIIAEALRADEVGDRHQAHDRQAQPVGAEVARHEAREDVQRRAALARRGDDLVHVRECVEVKTFTNSGMIAPASVPQVITVESCHHSVAVAAELGDQQVATARR